MLKRLCTAAALALCLAGSAQAAPAAPLSLRIDGGSVPAARGGLGDGIYASRSAPAIIASDALYGGIAGLAIGAGVALLEGSNNWGRDLAIGAGAGLIIGGVYGVADSASRDRIAVVDASSRARDRASQAPAPSVGYGARF